MKLDRHLVVLLTSVLVACGPGNTTLQHAGDGGPDSGIDAGPDAGFAVIEVTPQSLTFTEVAVGTRATQTFTIANVGSAAGTAEVGVAQGAAQALYTVIPSGAIALQPGDSVAVDVVYAPVDPSVADSAYLVVTTGVALFVNVGLSGSAVAPTCSYVFSPQAINFGENRPGTDSTTTFTITDVGPNDCWVSNLALDPMSASAFSLLDGPIALQHLSAPYSDGGFPTAMTVIVGFVPPQIGQYIGKVDFDINDPADPNPWLDLSGVGEGPCFLVMPSELNFGTVGISNGQCANAKRKFVAVNGCTYAVDITSVTLADGGAFSLFELPSLPLEVAGGQTSVPFEVQFRPKDAGTYTATVYVQTDERMDPLGVYVTGTAVGGSDENPPDMFTFEGSYIFVLSEGGPLDEMGVSVDGTMLPPNDWSYDPLTLTLVIDSTLVTLHTGDLIAVTFLVCN